MTLSKQVYLAFVGKRDPYRSETERMAGPNLSFLLDEDCPPISKIHFLVHEDCRQNHEELVVAIKEKLKLDLSFSLYKGSPASLSELLKFSEETIDELFQKHGKQTILHCNLSPGTPQMQFALLLLASKFPSLCFYQILDGLHSQKSRSILSVEFPTTLVQSGPPIARNYGNPGTSLYGQLQSQLENLMDAQSRILLVSGESGTGKTTLLREYARQKSLGVFEIYPTNLGSEKRLREAIAEAGKGGFPLVKWTTAYEPDHFQMVLDCFDNSTFGGAIELNGEIFSSTMQNAHTWIRIPPLRERRADLLQAIVRVSQKTAEIFKSESQLPQEVTHDLSSRKLAKNHYELESLLFTYFQTGTLPKAPIEGAKPAPSPISGFSLKRFLEQVEVSLLKDALEKYPDHAKAARALDMPPNSFRKKICEQYNLSERHRRS